MRGGGLSLPIAGGSGSFFEGNPGVSSKKAEFQVGQVFGSFTWHSCPFLDQVRMGDHVIRCDTVDGSLKSGDHQLIL